MDCRTSRHMPSVVEAVNGEDAIRVIERDEAQLLDIVLTGSEDAGLIRPRVDRGTPRVSPCIAGPGHVSSGRTSTQPPYGALCTEAVRAR